MVQGKFPPAWLRQQYSVLRQRGSAAFHQVWKAAAPAGSRGLWTIKDASKKTLDRLHAMPWRALALRYRPLLIGFGGLLLLLAIWKVPQWQATRWEGRIEAKEVAKQESDTRTTVVQAIGGAVLLIGLYFTAKTWRTTQEGQITDRFTKAINQLGETGPEKLAIRLGGIYGLERIARDSERDHWPIMEILTAYVRQHARLSPEQPAEDAPPNDILPSTTPELPPPLAADIQAVMTVLGRRTHTYRKGEDHRLDLRGTDLRGVNLREAHLEGAEFWNTHLETARLISIHLEKADFREAHLEGARLIDVHLEGAGFTDAHLKGTFLADADMKRVNLSGAHLEGAELYNVHLEGAFLWDAYLDGALFTKEVHLEGAYLWNARMEKADFRGAFLEGADLRNAHLRGAMHLTIEQLSTVKTLYLAELDPPLAEQITRAYPQLWEWPRPDGGEKLNPPAPGV